MKGLGVQKQKPKPTFIPAFNHYTNPKLDPYLSYPKSIAQRQAELSSPRWLKLTNVFLFDHKTSSNTAIWLQIDVNLLTVTYPKR